MKQCLFYSSTFQLHEVKHYYIKSTFHYLYSDLSLFLSQRFGTSVQQTSSDFGRSESMDFELDFLFNLGCSDLDSVKTGRAITHRRHETRTIFHRRLNERFSSKFLEG